MILAPPGSSNINIDSNELVAIYGYYDSFLISHTNIGVVRGLHPKHRNLRVRQVLLKESNLGFIKAIKQARQIGIMLGLTPNIRISELSAVQQHLLCIGCAIARGYKVLVAEDFGLSLSPSGYLQVTQAIKELIDKQLFSTFVSISACRPFLDHYTTTIQIL